VLFGLRPFSLRPRQKPWTRKTGSAVHYLLSSRRGAAWYNSSTFCQRLGSIMPCRAKSTNGL
jgi:hypothetical protein